MTQLGKDFTKTSVQTLLVAFFRIGNTIEDADDVVVLQLTAHIGRQTLSIWKHCQRNSVQRDECGQAEDNGGGHGDDVGQVQNW